MVVQRVKSEGGGGNDCDDASSLGAEEVIVTPGLGYWELMRGNVVIFILLHDGCHIWSFPDPIM